MNCPKCGLQSLADQKFCRSCGASLQMTTQPLAEPGMVSGLERTPTIDSNDESPRGNSFVLWGFIIMFVGAAIGIMGKKLFHEDIITVVGALISLAGIFLTVYPYLSPPRRKKSSTSFSSEPKVLTPSQPKEYLPAGSNIEFVPSITEITTDLLKSSVATSSRQKEDDESGSDKSEM